MIGQQLPNNWILNPKIW